jgi:hypothetical protein
MKYIISGVIYLTRSNKIKIKLDNDLNYLKNRLETKKPIYFMGTTTIKHNLSEDYLCNKLALKN